MAYVAISGALRDEVTEQIKKMEAAEMKSVGEKNYNLSGNLEMVNAALWKKHLPLKAQMPKEWQQGVEYASIRFNHDYGDGSMEHTVTVYFVPVLMAPPTTRTYGLILRIDPTQVPEMTPILEHYGTVLGVKQRWKKVHDQVSSFLVNCKSLNEAYKLWPQIEMYIPAKYMEKMRMKRDVSERGESKAASILKDMDTDHLTASAVIARMSGSSTK